MSQQKLADIYKYLCTELTEFEARMILAQRSHIDWAQIITRPDLEVDVEEILKDLEERKRGKPLSRIYGEREFWGLRFRINEHTLDPRPDSETLIEAALTHYKTLGTQPETILDLGTGSGCLLLALLSEFANAWGIGVDLSFDAAKTARGNAARLNLPDRCAFLNADWAESIDAKFDLIIANPPYIESDVIPNLEKEVRNHDPILALDGGKDGMQDYNVIFSMIFRLLKPDGIALFEIGFDQSEKISRLSEKYGLSCGRIHPDLAGNPRVVEIFL